MEKKKRKLFWHNFKFKYKLTILNENIPNHTIRNIVKPGITGWAQTHGERGETKTVDDMRRRVEKEIDGLYDRLASSLREENERLKATVKRLTEENAVLRLKVKNLQ